MTARTGLAGPESTGLTGAELIILSGAESTVLTDDAMSGVMTARGRMKRCCAAAALLGRTLQVAAECSGSQSWIETGWVGWWVETVVEAELERSGC